MGEFTDFMRSRLPGTIALPSLFAELFDWVESNGWVVSAVDGDPIATLGPNEWWLCDGTSVSFQVDSTEERTKHTQAWLGVPGFHDQLVPFARTGGDGSYAAFWVAPDAAQRVVHLGSGSGSVLACVLAEEPADFLRLLAIGYPEICWLDHNNVADLPSRDDGYSVVNQPYQDWLTQRGLTVPATASEVITTPAQMTDEESSDLFWNWLKITCGW